MVMQHGLVCYYDLVVCAGMRIFSLSRVTYLGFCLDVISPSFAVGPALRQMPCPDCVPNPMIQDSRGVVAPLPCDHEANISIRQQLR